MRIRYILRTLCLVLPVLCMTCATAGEGVDDRTSSAQSGRREHPAIVGATTTTTLFEDFACGTASMPMDHLEEGYGDRVRKIGGTTDLGIDEARGGIGTYSFSARFDRVNLLEGWEGYDSRFYFDLETGEPAGAYDGVALSVMPHSFSGLTVSLKQYRGGDPLVLHAPFVLAPGEWHDLKLPFGLFTPWDPSAVLDRQTELILEFSVDFLTNYDLWHFRSGTEVSGSVSVDDIGFYTRTSDDSPGVLEDFEDETTRIAFTGEVYGSGFYVDYGSDDAGVVMQNPAVSDQRLRVHRVDGGPSGTYLSLVAELELHAEQAIKMPDTPISVFLKGYANADWQAFRSISLLVRSNIPAGGYSSIVDLENDAFYSTDIELNESWTRLRLPFDRLHGESGSLAEAETRPTRVQLILNFGVPEDTLRGCVGEGLLRIELDVDELFLLKD